METYSRIWAIIGHLHAIQGKASSPVYLAAKAREIAEHVLHAARDKPSHPRGYFIEKLTAVSEYLKSPASLSDTKISQLIAELKIIANDDNLERGF